MTASPAEIADILTARAARSEQVLGSQLGDAVRDHLPGTSLKSFGGLRRFVATYCPELKWFGGHGGDDIYSLAKGGDPPSSSEQLFSRTPWAAFATPTIPDVVAVSKNGELRVVPAASEIPSGFSEVSKVSVEEHRALAEEFLNSVDDLDHVASLKKALERGNDYWPEWQKAVGNSGLLSEWLAHRGERIEGMFVSRLNGAHLDLDEDAKRQALHVFLSVKLASSRVGNVMRPFRQPTGGNAALRPLAHRVIDQLSDEELRRIWLPLGLILDVSGR
jgi:hypothetical protein